MSDLMEELEDGYNIFGILRLAGARVMEYNQGYRIYLGRGI